jgi:dUTP pyrophosphatase
MSDHGIRVTPGSGRTAAELLSGLELYVEFAKTDPRAQAPRNAYGNDAGWDLFALEYTPLSPHVPCDVRTGIAVAIPDGYYGRIVGRSSSIRKRRIQVQEGIIDAGFRGELFSCCIYLGDTNSLAASFDATAIAPGESVAQLIIQPVPLIQWAEVETLAPSKRGEQGFGSSGS